MQLVTATLSRSLRNTVSPQECLCVGRFARRMARGGRLENDLGPTIGSVVEVFVCLRRFAQWQFVRNDHRRLRFSCRDQVTEFSIGRIHPTIANGFRALFGFWRGNSDAGS